MRKNKNFFKKKVDNKWIFYIDVGSLNPDQIDEYISKIKKEMIKLKESGKEVYPDVLASFRSLEQTI